jgi:capsular exopolysaccharide synthesis family protein
MQDSSSSSPTIQIDPKVFLAYVLRYWYFVLIGLLGGVIYAYYQVRYTPASYSTDARMLVKDEYSSWGQEYFLPGMELVSSRNRLVNEIGIIKSFPLMERVAEDLAWDISYFKIGNIKTTEMYPSSEFKVKVLEGKGKSGGFYLNFESPQAFRISSEPKGLENKNLHTVGKPFQFKEFLLQVNQVHSGINLDNNYSFKLNTPDYWARYFQRALNINVENQESSILILSENNQTPAKSIDFLNALMKTYIEWGQEQSNQIAANTIAFVDEQLRSIADSLVVTEHRLEKFHQKNFSERIFISEENAGNNMQEVLELEELLTQRSVQKEYYAALIRTLQSDEFTAFPSAAVFGFQDYNVDEMIGRIHELVEEHTETSYQLTKNSGALQRQNSVLQKQKEALIRVAKANQTQVEGLIDSLRTEIKKAENKVLQIPGEQREYFNLRRENKLLNDLYTFLLNKRSEAGIAKASNLPKAQILDFADQYRVSYIGPHPSNIYTTAIAVGLAMPLALILIIYLLNNKIVDPTDLEKITSIPLLGSVGFRKDLDNNLVVSGNLKSIVAESYRSIRTNLNFMVEGKEKIKILVTSSISGEGKTFTSINLAAIYVASGKKTVILGADLRKPKIFQDFGLSNSVGLSTYLINKGNLAEVVQKTKVENLDLISAGPIPPNPAELIESHRMGLLMKELEEQYDVIIIDSPPLGLVTDALLLKKYADAGLYIVRHDYTKKAHLKNINQLYEDGVISKIGLIVNAVENKKGIAGYGYGTYGYGYGYGYGYYAEDKS